MMKLLLLLLPVVVLTTPAAARSWTNSEGRSIEADFVSADGQTVLLRIRGKETRYPLEKLSQADRDWITAQSAGPEDEKKPVNPVHASDMEAFIKEIDKTYPPSDLRDRLPTGTVVTQINGKGARDSLDGEADAAWKAGGWFSSPQRARFFAYRIPLAGEQGDEHTIHCLVNGREEVQARLHP